MHKKNLIKINYFYYGFFLLFISFVTLLNVASIETMHTDHKKFFLFHAIAQPLLEIGGLVLIGYFLKINFSKWVFLLFLGISFLFFLTHLIDLILIKVIGLSFFEALSLVLDETYANFLEMLTLSGIPFYIWIVLATFACFLPFIGIFFYQLCEKLSKKFSINIRKNILIHGCSFLLISLIFYHLFAFPDIDREIYRNYKKALPLKTTFFPLKYKKIHLQHFLKKPPSEKQLFHLFENLLPLQKKPNIYLFIIESLREDCITFDIAPTIYDFKQNNISFDLALANSNNTHSSWYSIFHGYFPFSWAYAKNQNRQSGSIFLNILKKAGYTINVYSSAELLYYKMDELLFGKEKHLIDHFYAAQENNSAKKDQEALKNLLQDIHQKKSANLFIIFLDSTHFHYNWPEDFPIKFYPVKQFFPYLTKKQLLSFKNRYLNSIYFIDSLFQQFLQFLKQEKVYQDSLIILTSDHGEEFFENGHLFHASHLSHLQTHIPIYYKFGENQYTFSKKQLKLSSHVDIFPSILDYLFQQDISKNIFDGHSIFQKQPAKYVISTRYNGSRTPYEFFIHNGEKKALLKFSKKNIFHTKKLKLLSVKNFQDEVVSSKKEKKEFLQEVKKALIPLTASF